MAGDWIKIEHALPGKPEVMQMAEILGVDEMQVVGHLVCFWCWVDQNMSPSCPSVTVATKASPGRNPLPQRAHVPVTREMLYSFGIFVLVGGALRKAARRWPPQRPRAVAPPGPGRHATWRGFPRPRGGRQAGRH